MQYMTHWLEQAKNPDEVLFQHGCQLLVEASSIKLACTHDSDIPHAFPLSAAVEHIEALMRSD